MPALFDWPDDDASLPAATLPQSRDAHELPQHVAAALWRGSELGRPVCEVRSTGFAELDAELPGGGWPCRGLTELLQPQPAVAEWRLLSPAMRRIVLVSPPMHPHLPGLRHAGLDERHLVWIQADTPAERLWSTEQLIKANAAGLLVAWLPQVRPEQIRRLQVCAQSCDGPVILCRPAAAANEPSAAPLRVMLRAGLDWTLELQIVKRKGATHDGLLQLPSVPFGLDALLTPRLREPSALLAARRIRDGLPVEVSHAVGRATSRPALQPFGAR